MEGAVEIVERQVRPENVSRRERTASCPNQTSCFETILLERGNEGAPSATRKSDSRSHPKGRIRPRAAIAPSRGASMATG